MTPNLIPKKSNGIAIIGEAPGTTEELNGRPFVGQSGSFLESLCSSVGIAFSDCYLGNVSQHRPPANNIDAFEWGGMEIQHGLSNLRTEIAKVDPNIVILLGNIPLKAAKDPVTPHPLEMGHYEYTVGEWRGSYFMANHVDSPFLGRQCISTYHPAACLHGRYDYKPLIRFDLARAKRRSGQRIFTPPVRLLQTCVDAEFILRRLAELRRSRALTSIDIEGGIDTMTCISIAPSPQDAFIVPFVGPGGNFFATEEEEVAVWRALADFLSDPLCPKVLQNSLYDCFVLAYSYKIIVRGIVDDTMLKHWEAYCELPKGLGFLCSIYTDEPYYKHERKEEGFDTHWTYCCRDSACTHEVNGVLEKSLTNPTAKEHYRFNMDMLNPLLYMELRGMRYDVPAAAIRREQVKRECWALNYELDLEGLTTFDFRLSREEAKTQVMAIAGKKRGGWRKEFQEDLPFLLGCLEDWPPTDPADRGRFNAILGTGVNIKSPDFKKLMYDIWGLPVRRTKDGTPTTNYEALLLTYKSTKHDGCRLAMEISGRRTRGQMLGISADADGRIRCGYNVVGTDTGRTSCYTSPTGSGYNLQTIPEYDRDLIMADPDHWMFQLDLAGADLWTVAAYLAFLGETTLMDDLLAGIKPPRVIALMMRHGPTISNLSRPELLERCKEVKKEDWDYFASKIGMHGTDYLMGPDLMARQMFVQSGGKVDLGRTAIYNIQNMVKMRYRITKLHDWMGRQLKTRPQIQSASGHVRHFFNRVEDALGEALAHEPQMNTTYANNKAVLRLWNDSENHRSNGSLLVEPLHVVHDALVGQFPKTHTDWAIAKLRTWYANPIRIANQTITIPFEGGYGPSWGKLTEGKI